MPRIRYIKPDFFRDEDLGKLSPLCRLAFAGLWCYADKAGRLKDRPVQLKVEILPYDEIDFNEILETLAKSKPINNHSTFITRYVVNDENYIQINKFTEHQKVHHTEKESLIPPISLTVKKPRNTRGKTVTNPPYKGTYKGMEMEMEGTPLPNWIFPEGWNAFIEMRKKIGYPITDYGIKKALKKLEGFKEKGYDPNEIIDTTVMNGYRGFFEPNKQKKDEYL